MLNYYFQYLYTLFLISISSYSCYWVKFVMMTQKQFLSTKYFIFSDVVFIFVIFFLIGFIVRNLLCPTLFNQNYFSFFFSQDILSSNGSPKLIINKRNRCLNLITNVLSNPKIFSKDIQIFNYFLRMLDFGHFGEFLKKIELYFVRWLVLL